MVEFCCCPCAIFDISIEFKEIEDERRQARDLAGNVGIQMYAVSVYARHIALPDMSHGRLAAAAKVARASGWKCISFLCF